MHDDYIEKASVRADLYLTDGSLASGLVYIEPSMSLLSSMMALLVGDRRLIPFRGESGELAFIGRTSIAALRFEFEDTVPPWLDASIHMLTSLAGGHQLEGTLHVPSTGGRISDMLDAAESWMLMVADNWAAWIASDLIVKWEAP